MSPGIPPRGEKSTNVVRVIFLHILNFAVYKSSPVTRQAWKPSVYVLAITISLTKFATICSDCMHDLPACSHCSPANPVQTAHLHGSELSNIINIYYPCSNRDRSSINSFLQYSHLEISSPSDFNLCSMIISHFLSIIIDRFYLSFR